MALTTSLAGRVRNTSLPKRHALLPLLEAVVNGLQAIDARFGEDVNRGRLSVTIRRSAQDELDLDPIGPGRAALRPVVGFDVADNGVGFTPDNMTSFETLDSDYKSAMGCRGVGRLLWLKAFDDVAIHSTYDDAGTHRKRRFRFSVEGDVEPLASAADVAGPDGVGTLVRMDGFRKPYQQCAAKTVDAIAREVFEHCIWYFLRPGGAPEVTVSDGDDTVSLNELLDDFVFSALPTTTIDVKGEKFDMVNLCLRSSTRNPSPRLYWCAANRVVVEENLTGKVSGLYGKLRDDAAEFTYVCYLSSTFLDDHVRADRTAFDIPDRVPDDALIDEVSWEDIHDGVLTEVEKLLATPLSAARELGRARVHDFVSRRAPRYRPVLARLEALGLSVDPSIRDQDLELLLHRGLQKLEAEAIAEGQAIFAESGSTSADGYDERLKKYLDAMTEINQSDLAAYVSRRRAILDVLTRLIRSDADGSYCREDAIHSLLIPMRTDSNEIGADASNLWIIDERLAFHDYLASDRPLKSMPITESDSMTRPDVLATRFTDVPVLTAEGETLPLPSIVVVEIKRPLRDDAAEGKDPIRQCLQYVKRVRAGGVRTASGRPVPRSQEVPAYCYIVADLTPTVLEACEMADLQPTSDGLGYFGYNKSARAYVEVLSFDRLVNAATERNRAFFDKLGLPAS